MASFCTPRFECLPEEKKDTIISAALREFAQHGYEGANTNRIASAAGVSVGSLFTYFASKENLFRHIVTLGSQVLKSTVAELTAADMPFEQRLEALVRMSIEQSRRNVEFSALYHELTTIGNEELATSLAAQWETITATTYTEVIAQAQARGEVREDISAGTIALLIDSILMSFQFTSTSRYYRNRQQIFAPGTTTDEELVHATRAFILEGIGPK